MTDRPRAPRRRFTQVVALGVALGLLLTPLLSLVQARPAQAHAYVVGETPGDGEELRQLPAEIRITFDEPVTLPNTPDDATVIDTAGARVDTGRARLVNGRATLLIGVKPGLPHGTYIASWSVISADTHPVGGSLQFGFGVPATAGAVATPTPSPALNLLAGLVKGALYLGLVLGLGVLPAVLLLGAETDEYGRARGLAFVGLTVAALSSLAQLVVQYSWTASAAPPVGGAARAAAIASFAHSSYSAAVGIRLLAVVAAAALLLPRPRPHLARQLAFGVAGLVATSSVVVNGHGGSGPWWQFVSTLLHASAALAWIGGLTVLGWLLLRRRLTPERLHRMPRWSLYAGVSTVVLVLSGVLQAIVEVRYPAALVQTTYGWLLIGKVALVLITVGLGVSGFLWTQRQLRPAGLGAAQLRPAAGQTARLRGRMRWEAGTAALVVVVSGVLSSINPAQAAWAPQYTRHLTIGPYTVTFEVKPARRGPESFRVTTVQSAAWNSPLPESLSVQLGQPTGPVQSLDVQFPYRIPGAIHPGKATPLTFVSASTNVPDAGDWIATVTIEASALDQYTNVVRYHVS